MSWWDSWGQDWAQVALGVLAGLLLVYVVLLAALWKVSPPQATLREALRLLPDLLRLVRSLAADRSLPRRVRVYLVLLLGYLAMPIDLVPDFVPVLGYADDAVVVAVVLRAVIRAAGRQAVQQHWSGTPIGLDLVLRLAGQRSSTPTQGGQPVDE
ncbi:DUF1232 domain-containing protein [Kineococcus sp. LSe6-4]|uniref:DUF1232 domain-containing protein n=1 Tax=Kineococcus halophytocola TaxID=3234027 RepID=A0ABV4H644_9ACTN